MSQLFPGRAPLIPRAPTSPQCAISKVRRATRIDDPDATNFPPQSVLDRYSVPGTQPRFVGANCWDPWRHRAPESRLGHRLESSAWKEHGKVWFCRCRLVPAIRIAPPGARRMRLHSAPGGRRIGEPRSEEHTSELQSRFDLVCRLLLE